MYRWIQSHVAKPGTLDGNAQNWDAYLNVDREPTRRGVRLIGDVT